MRVFACSALIFVASAHSALACAERVSIDPAQARDLVAQMADPATAPIDLFYAFETLMCSDQSGLRHLALRQGAVSDNPVSAGQVITRALLDKATPAIGFVAREGLGTAHYNLIRDMPLLTLPLQYRDLYAQCLSIHRDDECNPDPVLAVSGTEVVLRVNWNSERIEGVFIQDGEVLRGQVTYRDLALPAEINLF